MKSPVQSTTIYTGWTQEIDRFSRLLVENISSLTRSVDFQKKFKHRVHRLQMIFRPQKLLPSCGCV
jgi:hypothetical protein